MHSNIYDYSLVQFPVKYSQRIIVNDPEFGEFETNVNRHLSGAGHRKRGALKSAVSRSMSLDQFIARAKASHNVEYDYSKVDISDKTKKICIIDPEYGEFWQLPFAHLAGQDHPLRKHQKIGNSRRMGATEFIQKAIAKHGGIYDYSKVIYSNCDTKVCIIDPEYGEFWQSPWQHLRSHGCPARTKNKEWLDNMDHIIPLSILREGKVANKWFEDRPLFKFLNSNVNLTSVTAKFNREKSDKVAVKGMEVAASSVRNNYEIISYLIKTLLKVDPTDIIRDDKEFISNFFKL